MVYKWLDIIQRWLPGWCLLCGARCPAGQGVDLCSRCHDGLPGNRPACPHCAQPLPSPGVCGHCQRQPPPYRSSFAPWRYEAPLDRLILRLKTPAGLAVARTLGCLLTEQVRAADLPRPDLLLPVPLHRQRLQERGFNQAALITRQLSGGLQLPWRSDLLLKHRESADQRGLGRRQRRRNLRGCFFSAPLPRGCHVALVDDVITTGATAWEATAALRRAGAGRVDVWSLARTP